MSMVIQIQIKDKQITLFLKEKGQILDSLDFPEERQLSEKLLPSIDKLLKKNKLRTEYIEMMAVESEMVKSPSRKPGTLRKGLHATNSGSVLPSATGFTSTSMPFSAI